MRDSLKDTTKFLVEYQHSARKITLRQHTFVEYKEGSRASVATTSSNCATDHSLLPFPMSTKKLSARYNSVIAHYHQKDSSLGPSELAESILLFEGLDVTEDTLRRMCKQWLWNKAGVALPNQERRKLVISDLHAPFIVPGALEFCQALYKKWRCNSVVFIGDIIDGHAWSFHTPDVDGMRVGHELDAAIA